MGKETQRIDFLLMWDRVEEEMMGRAVNGLVLGGTLWAAFGATGCKMRAGDNEKGKVKRHLAGKEQGLLEREKMGLYRSGKQFCPAAPEFHIKPEDKHAPWDRLYGYLCLDKEKNRVTLFDDNPDAPIASADFSSSTVGDVGTMGGTADPVGQAGAGTQAAASSKRFGHTYRVLDERGLVIARFHQDENRTLRNVVSKTFHIRSADGKQRLGSSIKLPFTLFHTVFELKATDKTTPLGKIWSHFWNWTVHDLQKGGGNIDRRVFYMIPMMFELKNQLDAQRKTSAPETSGASGQPSGGFVDSGSSESAEGYETVTPMPEEPIEEPSAGSDAGGLDVGP